MATFDPKYGYYNSTSYGIRIDVSSVPDTATNSSKVTVVVYLVHPGINIKGRDGSVTIDGTTYDFSTPALDTEKSPYKIATKSKVVSHADDGKKQIGVSASFPYKLTSSTYGEIRTAKVSGTYVLDNIPRSSEIVSQTASVKANGTNKWQLTVSKHADAFRHKAMLTFGSKSYTTEAFDASTEYAIPVDWLDLIPTQLKSTVSVSIQTYSDETCTTAIGDPVATTFEIAVPDDAAPVVSDGWASVAPYNTGTATAAMNVYVQGYSKAKVTFDTAKITKKYGATSVTCRVEYDGATDASMTKVLAKSGTQRIYFRVTDSRGLSTVDYQDITVHEYSAPTLSGVSVYRCNASGAADDSGTYLYFKVDGSYSSCGGQNALTIKAGWKVYTNSTWASSATLESGKASILGGGSISTTSSYSARIIATDALGNTATYTTVIATSSAAFNLRKGGNGGAFGKYAEKENTLQSVWDIESDGDITAAKAVKGASAAITGTATAGSVVSTGTVQGGAVKATGAVSGASVAVTGAVTGASATISGAVTAGSLKSNGAVEGTMGTFTGGITGVNIYSASEVDTGGKWTDDKKIYRRTFSGSVTAGGNTELGTISSAATIVRMEGMFVRSGDGNNYVHAIPYYNGTTRYFLPFYDPATGKVFVQSTIAGSAHVIVDYTKA